VTRTILKFPIYLDNNATTCCDERVLDAMVPFFSVHYGNAASRTHLFGWQAEEAVELAREQIAALIGADSKEIIFTSGATEGDNLAIKGVCESYASKGNHIITVSTEHKAVLDTCKHLEKKGARVTYLPVQTDGTISPEKLEAAITPDTVLIVVMYANNETGVVQPVNQIGRIARRHQVLLFTDAAQACGKTPINLANDPIDILALSAHKIYGPKGVGALYVRRRDPRVRLASQMDGGGHERGMRSGTLNVPGIVGLGKACEICRQDMQTESKRLAALRDKLETGLLSVGDSMVNGSREKRMQHVTNISFAGADAGALMTACHQTLAVSSGSACTSASIEPSYVLKALGLDDSLAHSSLRFALGRFTTEEEIDFAIIEIKRAVEAVRGANAIINRIKSTGV